MPTARYRSVRVRVPAAASRAPRALFGNLIAAADKRLTRHGVRRGDLKKTPGGRLLYVGHRLALRGAQGCYLSLYGVGVFQAEEEVIFFAEEGPGRASSVVG